MNNTLLTLEDIGELENVGSEVIYESPPWRSAPFPIVNWWDVLEFSAVRIIWCGRALADIRHDCLLGSCIMNRDALLFNPSLELDEK